MSREVAHSLSPREASILRLASEGHTDSGIAGLLEISEGTVGTYWGRIRTKLGPFSRPELVAIAIRTELAVQIADLEAQRDRLRNELDRSTAEEKLYEEIVDAADEGVLIVALDGSIEHANPFASSILGYEPGELVGADLSSLIPEKSRLAHFAHVREFAQHPGNRQMNGHSDTYGMTKQGAEIPLYVVISSVHRDHENKVACFLRKAPDPVGPTESLVLV